MDGGQRKVCRKLGGRVSRTKEEMEGARDKHETDIEKAGEGQRERK